MVGSAATRISGRGAMMASEANFFAIWRWSLIRTSESCADSRTPSRPNQKVLAEFKRCVFFKEVPLAKVIEGGCPPSYLMPVLRQEVGEVPRSVEPVHHSLLYWHSSPIVTSHILIGSRANSPLEPDERQRFHVSRTAHQEN